jgi:zinc transporter ZupT
MRQTFACTLIGVALALIAALVALLLGDAFAPARLPPLLACYAAAAAGVALLLGLAALCPEGSAAPPRHGAGRVKTVP